MEKSILQGIVCALIGGIVGALIITSSNNDKFEKSLHGQNYTISCPYEYGECPNVSCSNNPQSHSFTPTPGEYQIDIDDKGTFVYDNGRFVGFLPFDSTQAFDSLMIEDNR